MSALLPILVTLHAGYGRAQDTDAHQSRFSNTYPARGDGKHVEDEEDGAILDGHKDQSRRSAPGFGLFGLDCAAGRRTHFLRQGPEHRRRILHEALRSYDAVGARTVRSVHHAGLRLDQHSC